MSKVISIIIYNILKLLNSTFRYEYVGESHLEKIPGGSYLLSIWHCQLANGILAQTSKRHVVMVSKSKDADPVAYTCEKMGHRVLRGSSRKGNRDKGGGSALLGMVDEVKAGIPAALTVDGPTGPARKVKYGIIKLAHMTDAPIVPYVTLCNKYWEFNSWDKFRFPKPFSKVKVIYGEPIDVSNMSVEEAALVVEKAITITEESNSF